jgi:hypothetical protein
MHPIIRRSLVLYLTHLLTWCGILGRFLLVRDWPAFEIIPLFMPVWLVSSVVFTERDESYGFLRTLPVTDGRIVRTKFGLILGAATLYWLFMVGAALVRRDSSLAGPATLVYITIVSAYGLLMGTCFQVLVWRVGASIATSVGIVFVILSLVLTIVHTASLKSAAGWPVLSRTGAVEWLAGAPWLSIPILGGLALVAFYGLLQAGIGIKASSEACL